jgi:hypothetical protein
MHFLSHSIERRGLRRTSQRRLRAIRSRRHLRTPVPRDQMSTGSRSLNLAKRSASVNRDYFGKFSEGQSV